MAPTPAPPSTRWPGRGTALHHAGAAAQNPTAASRLAGTAAVAAAGVPCPPAKRCRTDGVVVARRGEGARPDDSNGNGGRRGTGVVETTPADAPCGARSPAHEQPPVPSFISQRRRLAALQARSVTPPQRGRGGTPPQGQCCSTASAARPTPPLPPVTRGRARACHHLARKPPSNPLPQPMADRPSPRASPTSLCSRRATTTRAPAGRWPTGHGCLAPVAWRLPNSRRSAVGGPRGGDNARRWRADGLRRWGGAHAHHARG